MTILALFLVIAIGMLVLLIFRAGIPRALRAIGSFFWAAAAAYEKWVENFGECMAKAREMEGVRE